MTRQPEAVLVAEILVEYGARDEGRLWRNVTTTAYVGKPEGRTADGRIILRDASPVQTGLCVGSADLIGIWNGRFVAIEVKQPGKYPRKKQKRFLEVVRKLGGIAGVARSVEDVGAILREA